MYIQVVKGTGKTSSATRNVYEQVPSAEGKKRSFVQVCHSSEHVKFSILGHGTWHVATYVCVVNESIC